MAQLPHDTVTPYKASSQSKKEQVAAMFDKVAGRYDFMNRLLTGGIDIRWRKKAISTLKKYQPRQILDIATGTGDLAMMAHRILQPEKITGIDISTEMLEVGRKKISRANLSGAIVLQKGDSENLEFADNTFEAAMAAFGVRNFENLEKGLSEIYRVLKQGGQLMILEFSQPKPGPFRPLYRFYMKKIAPQFARLFSKDTEAYQYLNESAKAFPEREAFLAIMKSAGFSNTSYQPLSLGICCIYRGEKAAS